ncbi:MAG: sortase [Saccharofermentans sp.]|nr:sortase [Saccharofermentans sp.]
MRSKVSVAGLVICLMLSLGGLIYIVKEPCKTLIREHITKNVVEDYMEGDIPSEIQVPATDLLAINGEEDLDMSSFENETLHLAGVLEIPSIEVLEPCYIECDRVALRYGVCIWPDSVMPGDKGNSTILGHRNRHLNTIFCRLQEIEVGAQVHFTRVSGEVLDFEVTDTLNAAPCDIEGLIAASASKMPRLTIVTCATELGAGYRFVAVCDLCD